MHPATDPGWPKGVERIDYVSAVDDKADWATALAPAVRADWIIFIHGHGSSGDQLYTRADMKKTWLPLFQQRGMGILTVNLRGNAWMSPAAAQDLHDLLAWARNRYPVKRLIFVSGSMGGTSNLIYAAVHPEDVDGVVALCPATDLTVYYKWCLEQKGPSVLQEIARAVSDAYGGPPGRIAAYERHSAVSNADQLKMPVYVAHGSADLIIPVTQSRELAERLAGSQAFRYEEISGGDHEAPLGRAREGLEWVLSKLRQ